MPQAENLDSEDTEPAFTFGGALRTRPGMPVGISLEESRLNDIRRKAGARTAQMLEDELNGIEW